MAVGDKLLVILSGEIKTPPLSSQARIETGVLLRRLHAPVIALVSVVAQEAANLRGPYFGQSRPGETPVLFAPEMLQAPGGNHATVVFTPDGMEAYWTPIGRGRGETARMSRMEEGIWTAPREVDFGMGAPVTEVALSPVGSRVFFLSRKRTAGDPVLLSDHHAPERL